MSRSKLSSKMAIARLESVLVSPFGNHSMPRSHKILSSHSFKTFVHEYTLTGELELKSISQDSTSVKFHNIDTVFKLYTYINIQGKNGKVKQSNFKYLKRGLTQKILI